jgi:hypothetical protein
MNGLPAFFAATVAESFYGFENRFRFVADEVLVDVDHQHRRPLSETGALAVAGKSENISIAWR